MPLLRISWAYPEVADVVEWGIYARQTPPGMFGGGRGQRIATAPGSERYAEVELPEGRYLLHVVPRGPAGTEPDPDAVPPVEVIVSGRDVATIEGPRSAGIALVDPHLVGRVIQDPPRFGDEPYRVQVIQGGADPLQGMLLGEYEPIPGGPMAPNASRQPLLTFPIEGGAFAADMPATRTLWLRPVNAHGQGGTGIARTMPTIDRPGHYGVTIASIVGTTRVGIAASASADPWELDATDGVRLLSTGTGSAAPSAWGTGEAGTLIDHGAAAPYFRSADLVTDEKDLGATVDAVLDLYAQLERKTLVSPAWSTMTGDAFGGPSAPQLDLEGRDEHLEEDGFWLTRLLTAEGHPTQPLRACRWEYVAGTSTPVPYTESDWKPYVPGEVIRARYVRLRLRLEEPTGYHQLIVPTVFAIARVLMRRTVSSAAPTHAAPPGSFHVDEGTGRLYVKGSGLSTSGWNEVAPDSAVVKEATRVDVASTTTETTVLSYTTPGGYGTLGKLHLRIFGDALNNTGANEVLTLRIKLGGSTLYDSDVTIATSANRRAWSLDLWLHMDGLGAAEWIEGTFALGSPSAPTVGVSAIIAAGTIVAAFLGDLGAIDLDSVGDTILVTAEWGASSASLSFRKEGAVATEH